MLSLDIDGEKIKVLAGNVKQGSAIIENYFEAETGGLRLLDEGAPEKLGGILRADLDKRDIKNNKCVVAISGTDLFFRRITLPKANPSHLKEMITHSLSGIQSIKDCYVDYVIEREHVFGGKKMLDLFVCGVPKKLASAYYIMVTSAGLLPHRMDVRQNCIRRLLAENAEINGESLRGKAVLLLDTGPSLFCADLVVDAKGVFERAVSIKPNPFDEFAAASIFAVNEEDIQPTNRFYAKISEETQKMIQFSLTRSLNTAIGQIYLYGENAKDAELAAFLTDSLGVKCNVIKNVRGLKLSGSYSGPALGDIFVFAAALSE